MPDDPTLPPDEPATLPLACGGRQALLPGRIRPMAEKENGMSDLLPLQRGGWALGGWGVYPLDAFRCFLEMERQAAEAGPEQEPG